MPTSSSKKKASMKADKSQKESDVALAKNLDLLRKNSAPWRNLIYYFFAAVIIALIVFYLVLIVLKLG